MSAGLVGADVILAGRPWLACAVILVVVALAVLVWAYLQASYAAWVRAIAALLKTTGIVLLAGLLLEPMFQGTRPKPGVNKFLVLADNSKSLQLADRAHGLSRGAAMKQRLADDAPWLTRLAQDFDLRRYAFDTVLRPLTGFSELTLDGESSALETSLTALAQRFQG